MAAAASRRMSNRGRRSARAGIIGSDGRELSTGAQILGKVVRQVAVANAAHRSVGVVLDANELHADVTGAGGEEAQNAEPGRVGERPEDRVEVSDRGGAWVVEAERVIFVLPNRTATPHSLKGAAARAVRGG